MDVEHRCAVRRPVDLEVTLKSAARPPATARVRNLAAGGLYLELPGRPLPPCAIVEIILKAAILRGDRRVTRLHRWAAMVVHREPGGAGLMFENPHGPDVAAILAAAEAGLARPRRSRTPLPLGHMAAGA